MNYGADEAADQYADDSIFDLAITIGEDDYALQITHAELKQLLQNRCNDLRVLQGSEEMATVARIGTMVSDLSTLIHHIDNPPEEEAEPAEVIDSAESEEAEIEQDTEEDFIEADFEDVVDEEEEVEDEPPEELPKKRQPVKRKQRRDVAAS